MILVGNGRLITMDKENPFIEDGCVVIEADSIKEVGTTDDMIAKYGRDNFIDARSRLIMPGMINMHHHIYSAFGRGMPGADEAPTWFLEILDKTWWRLDRQLMLKESKYSAYASLIESIKNGVTTFFDHHASQGQVKDSLFTMADVAKELGIRGSLCYEVTERDGLEKCYEAIEENSKFMEYTKKQDDDMMTGLFGLHASFTISDKTLYKCQEVYNGGGYHVHIAEGRYDVTETLKNSGCRVVERLEHFGVLGENTLGIHGVHVNPREIEILKETGTNIIHNPESNMGNAVGIPPIVKMLEAGIPVGLGTDGYTTDMHESMKVANIIHKHELCDPNAGGSKLWEMIFDNNPKIASHYMKKPVGVIKAGAYADVIIVDYNPITPINEDNYRGHILFGISGRATDTSIINGKIVMEDRIIKTVDEEKILRESREVAKELWTRL